ncbi:MAG: hypothetical protein R3F60_05695 [bacterium]
MDCADRHCTANPAVTVCPGERENSDAACADGIDNDGNGFIDCDDFSCTRNPWVTICGAQENSFAACTDGIDNDGNRFIDCDDFGCSRNALAGACRQNEAGFCFDGEDNDADGLLDCADPDCANAGACQALPPPPPPPPMPAFSTEEMQAFVDANCAPCHIGGGMSGGMALDDVVAATVGVMAGESDLNRVEPGNPELSYLFLKVTGRAPVGGRMPLGGAALSDLDIERIAGWITSLAE